MRTRSGQPQAFHPARIGPYEVLRRLGAGAMGEVFLARSPSSRLVAVKTIRPGLAEHPGYRRRFAHEVDAAKRVSGAFTAAVVGADPHADLPWLATVYVPAPSLEELVATCGPLAVSAVRWLAAGCAEALEDVHRAGLVHRDFKPANVLVTADGPRVIDFGLARRDGLPLGTAVGMVMGTPLYMAPEQAAGESVVGPAADVFALGATLYHAATGAALYQEERAVGVLLQKMRQAPDLTPVPRELRMLVAACLALNPADRPTPGSLVSALAPHLAVADAARPLPDAVLAYIEEYRVAQMELTRARRPAPGAAAEADTHVAGDGGEGRHAHDPVYNYGHDSGDQGGLGDSSGSGAESLGSGHDGLQPRHPSLMPGRGQANPLPIRRRAGQWNRVAVGAGVVLAFGVATASGLFLAGVVTPGDKDATQPQSGGQLSAAQQGPGNGNGSQPPGSPPPTASGNPFDNGGPPPQGPPPQGGPPPGGGPGGGPGSPPPGAVTESAGVRLGVRPPFGDPKTTYVLNGDGWPAGQTVTVSFLDAAVPSVRTVVDSSGTFSVALDQGAGAIVLADGRYHVRAVSGDRAEAVSFVVGPPLTP